MRVAVCQKKRIDLAPGPAGERFMLSDVQKASLEAAYRQKLSEELWNKIIAVTDELKVWGPFGATAVFNDKTLEKLDRLAKRARLAKGY
jgi:hypothetical protein